MKKIEVKLHRSLVAPLLDYLRELSVRAGTGGFPPQIKDTQSLDPEMAEIWEDELRNLGGDDRKQFFSLFGGQFIESGSIHLDEEQASAVLRSMAWFRLQIREKDLSEVPDEILEQGDLTLKGMSETEQKGYSAFVFLAALQEIVLEHLEPR
ncbi:MAG: hypothetical protein JJT75_13500 [Opitutales bacterium]|nr:hypothetical protein [Opitutales bacterium]MCH8540660.1 hypothetical protein [Opitutales bacterium]